MCRGSFPGLGPACLVALVALEGAAATITAVDREVVLTRDAPASMACTGGSSGNWKWLRSRPGESKTDDLDQGTHADLEITNLESNTTLKVKVSSLGDAGTYTCKKGNEKDVITAYIAPIYDQRSLTNWRERVKTWVTGNSSFTFTEYIVKVKFGDQVNLTCRLGAWPQPEISWMKNNQTYEPDEGVKIMANNSVLFFSAARYEDTGDYSCVAKNEYGFATLFVRLSVQSRLAALWPAIGIALEIILLLIIIFIARGREKKEAKAAAQADGDLVMHDLKKMSSASSPTNGSGDPKKAN